MSPSAVLDIAMISLTESLLWLNLLNRYSTIIIKVITIINTTINTMTTTATTVVVGRFFVISVLGPTEKKDNARALCYSITQ